MQFINISFNPVCMHILTPDYVQLIHQTMKIKLYLTRWKINVLENGKYMITVLEEN